MAKLQAYERLLETVLLLKYLGRPLMAKEYDWTAGIVNILKARKSWYHLAGILGQEGADTWTLGDFTLQSPMSLYCSGCRRGW